MDPKTEPNEDKSPNDIRSEWYQSLYGRIEEAIRCLLDFRKNNSNVVKRYSQKKQSGKIGEQQLNLGGIFPSPIVGKSKKPMINSQGAGKVKSH